VAIPIRKTILSETLQNYSHITREVISVVKWKVVKVRVKTNVIRLYGNIKADLVGGWV
jgi:hypothetical protein